MVTKKTILRLFSVFLVGMILLGAVIFPTNVRAAGITVNSLADTIKVDGLCTLREAIQNANNNAATNADCAAGSGADTITFSLSGTITLSSILPSIGDAAGLTLDGTGQVLTISGNHAVRVMAVALNDSLTLNNLTIANGSIDGEFGGGIINGGTLVITNSVFSGNSASLVGGGGIYNRGTLTITNSTFTGNSANDGDGGGIYMDGGTVTIANSTFSGNNTSGGHGGGIYIFDGDLTITDSTFASNSASLGSGGGIHSDVGTLVITNSIFSGNSANGGSGGGIYNNYDLTIKFSTFSGNNAGNGGGIYNSGAYLTIANSTFTGNTLNTGGNGSAILNTDYGGLTVVNSTFSGNSLPGSGASVSNDTGKVTLRNTIVANSVSGGNCDGTITNGGSNLDDGTTCGWGSNSGSMSNTNPLLGALTSSPAYFPLVAGSPAIDAGDDPTCAALPVNNQSQNGVARPQGAHCDIGAFEYTAPTFGDVPFDYSVTLGGIVYPLHDHIQALYDAGYTSGCSTNPLLYCPSNTLTRVEAAVFMLRGLQGTAYSPPTDPAGYAFTDDWSSPTVNWGRPWAEGMWDEGLTAGCQTSPLLFCPTTAFTRAEASVFGLRIENGAGYTPPAATHIFADDWSSPTISWAEAWAEQAYLDGLLPACGESGGKPLFCPSDLVTRAWAAYLIVEAKNLPLTP